MILESGRAPAAVRELMKIEPAQALLAAALALATVAIAAPFAIAAEPLPVAQDGAAPKPKRCYQCKGAGLVPCSKHAPDKSEKEVEFCTVELSRPCCGGLGEIVCPRCQGADADLEAFRRREKERQGWLAKAQALSKDTGEELVVVQSPHWYVGFGIDEVKAGKKRYDKHDAAHLYASRLEKLYDEAQKVFGEEAFPKSLRFDVHLFATSAGCTKLTQKLAGMNPGRGWKLYGPQRLYFATYDNPAEFPSDEEFHQNVVHNAAHLLIRRFGGYSPNFPAWLDNGFASLMEHRMFESTKTICFTEQPPDSPWKGSDWKEKVKKAAQAGDVKRFDEMCEEPIDSMDYRDHAFAFSYVDFLASSDRAKFVALVKDLQKEKPDSKASIKKAYGWILAELEEQWKRFAARG
jgi:hypothetical protein